MVINLRDPDALLRRARFRDAGASTSPSRGGGGQEDPERTSKGEIDRLRRQLGEAQEDLCKAQAGWRLAEDAERYTRQQCTAANQANAKLQAQLREHEQSKQAVANGALIARGLGTGEVEKMQQKRLELAESELDQVP